ncbi:MAG TPA: hypothetical protein VIV15_06585, partial [Anaerolineales bacterium]
MGHGALVYSSSPFEFGNNEMDIVVTGPRRSMFAQPSSPPTLRPYFAAPFGDMMIAGCFGLLAAAAEALPELAEPILGSLGGAGGSGTAPWDAG